MSATSPREPAREPEDLSDFFIERANAGDVEGLVALYEPDAVLAFPPGRVSAGHDEIRAAYTAARAPGHGSATAPPGTAPVDLFQISAALATENRDESAAPATQATRVTK
jgi:ketosteroid isomerase-like protein